MFAKTCRATVCVAAFLSAPGTAAAQPTVEQSDSRQPCASTKPRIGPLPESQWTDVHRGFVAKFSRDGRSDNGLKTLLHLPELAEGVMPAPLRIEPAS